jgi:four helix bundle protein
MGSKTFMDLKVWKLAHEVNISNYQLTESFPRRETYGMADQIRRASYSIPANIVEGFGRRSTRDKAHFYTIAMGSAEELKNGLIAARDLGYLQKFAELWPKVESVSKMLRSLTDAVLEGGSALMR